MERTLYTLLIASVLATVLALPQPNDEVKVVDDHVKVVDDQVKVVDEAINEGPCICPPDVRPVCGSDGNTYGNKCIMKCAGKDLTVAGEGLCTNNPKAVKVPSVQFSCSCPRNFRPVCGSDGETYQNECLLRCSGIDLSVAKLGRCEESKDDDKVKVVDIAPVNPACTCTRNYRPVCATDGKTYANECVMRCASQDLAVGSRGACEAKEGDSVLVVESASEAPCVCGKERKPVCSIDGITYDNVCLLRCAGKDIKDVGSCNELLRG